MPPSSPHAALAARLASGECTEQDLALAARVLRQTPIPPGELRRTRDDLFRRYAVAAYPTVAEIRVLARRVHSDARHYAVTRWRRDQHSLSCPVDIKTTPTAFLFEACRIGDVPSAETIRRALSGSKLPGK